MNLKFLIQKIIKYSEVTDSIIRNGTTLSKINVFLDDLFSMGLCQTNTISNHLDRQLDLIFAYDQQFLSVVQY